MDEKTEELRDIFMEVSDEETVTESQSDDRGSLDSDGPGPDEVAAVVARLRERSSFGSGLDDDALVTVVERFYEGADDAAIAEAVGTDRRTAFLARMDLHLVTDADLSPAFDGDAARELLAEGATPGAVADALDADPDAVERFAVAVAARDAGLRANHRFRDRFEELVADADLAGRLARDVREDGLEEATEGMETDVSF